jgi:aspartate racemase
MLSHGRGVSGRVITYSWLASSKAGAEFGAIASNTPHIVFPALRERSPIPLISIVEVACAAAAARGHKRVAILGSRATMGGRFYPDVFGRASIAVVPPRPEEQEFINTRYFGEIVNGLFRPETRSALVAIAARMRAEDGIDGVVLGGTELALLLSEPEYGGLPYLDTARLHVEAIVDWMIGGIRGACGRVGLADAAGAWVGQGDPSDLRRRRLTSWRGPLARNGVERRRDSSIGAHNCQLPSDDPIRTPTA